MARPPRLCPSGLPQHIVQRGNNKQICFASTMDFATYSNYLRETSERYGVLVHAWVFMSNHVHLLVTPAKSNSTSRMMQTLGRKYVDYFNTAYGRSGTLWEGRFKSCLVQTTDYLLQCYRYIELNPVRAGMVGDPGEYPWSSYRCNALGSKSTLLSPHTEYLQLARDEPERQRRYRELFKDELKPELLNAVRTATNRNVVFGNDKFRSEIEAALQCRLHPVKRGRPNKFESESNFLKKA